MKVWLDDVREAPDGWLWVRNAEDFKEVFACFYPHITEISFDHDIASFDHLGNEITGYHCFCIVEKHAFVNADYTIPKMTCHSSNPAGRAKILQGIRAMERWVA